MRLPRPLRAGEFIGESNVRLLIDGDVLRYRIGFACQKSVYAVSLPNETEHAGFIATFDKKKEMKAWIQEHIPDEEYEVTEFISPEPIENCLHSVKISIESMMERLGSTDVRVYMTGSSNFRDTLVDYYKANRDRTRKPHHYDNITQYLVDIWDAEVVEGYEADDQMSIDQYNFAGIFTDFEHTVICTIDKDLDMVPGWHYNFVTDEKYFITEMDGLRNFYCQMLAGDNSDNIPGLYQITGKKCNVTVFNGVMYADNEQQMWEHVHHIYSKAFYDMDPDNAELDTDAIHEAVTEKLREIGKLLWMKRTPDDNWEPPI